MKKLLSTKYNELGWNIGLLFLRLGVGYTMLLHGLTKLKAYGNANSEHNVQYMQDLFGSPIDGFLVIFAEFFCAIFLMLGLFTRFSLVALVITMCVAFFKTHHGSFKAGEMAFLYLMPFTCLLLTGPGKFSIDRMIAK
jgi:putative oxidoreductase